VQRRTSRIYARGEILRCISCSMATLLPRLLACQAFGFQRSNLCVDTGLRCDGCVRRPGMHGREITMPFRLLHVPAGLQVLPGRVARVLKRDDLGSGRGFRLGGIVSECRPPMGDGRIQAINARLDLLLQRLPLRITRLSQCGEFGTNGM